MRAIFILLICSISLSSYAGGKSPAALSYLSDEGLSKLEALYLLNDGALLHSCGYITSQAFQEKLSESQIKEEILKLIQAERPKTKTIEFEPSAADYDKLPYYSMGPGWPTGFSDDAIIEDLLDLGGSYLKLWGSVVNDNPEQYTYSGLVLNVDNFAHEFFAIYDPENSELVIFGIDVEAESNSQYCH